MKRVKPARNSIGKSRNAMETVILVIHLIIAVSLIAVVMLQRSEGGALGIGGGGGGSGNLFTARGVGNALTRTTAYLAVGFFCTSIALTVIATHRGSGSVIDTVTPPATSGSQTSPAQGTSGGDSSVLPKLAPAVPAQPQVPVSP
ncbi:preprotein translocase subunit SecG [Aestuariivirga sp.]|uniref:preprotein translocase subunit SecG n=1 Tax=Aestuariivirga sp. TaxID=2650926 RepID=UPI003BAB2F5E